MVGKLYLCILVLSINSKLIKVMSKVNLILCMLGCALSGQAAYEGHVYVDSNRNGQYDKGERTLANVCVSDGLNVVTTDRQGHFSLPGHEGARFIFITTPSGYQSDRKYYLRAEGEGKSYDFGLQEWKGRIHKDGSHSFVHISDTEIFNTINQDDWANEVRDYTRNEGASFIIHTGDICYENGLKNHINLMNTSNMGCPIFYCLGNHDLVKGAYGEELFESIYGPSWYSFDMGSTHYIILPMLGGDHAPGFKRTEVFRWMKNDLDQQPHGKPVIIFHHDLLSNTDVFRFDMSNGETLDLAEYNVKGWFYGHWHNQFMRRQGKVLTVSTSSLDKGGIDHSTTAFRTAYIDAKGDIETRLHYTYIDHSLQFASITNDQCTQEPSGAFVLSINAYNTTAPVTRITYSLQADNGKEIASNRPLAAQSDWNWRTSFVLPEAYRSSRIFVTAKAYCSDGSVSIGQTTFVPASSPTKEHLDWVTNLRANILYTHPVVANGKLFMATLDEDLRGEAALFALDTGTGQQLWRYPVRNSIKNTIAYAKGVVLAQDVEGYLYAIKADDGTLLWERKLDIDGLPALIEGVTAQGDTVFAGTGHGYGAYEVTTGRPLWTNKGWRQNQGATSHPVIAGDVVVSGTQWSGLYGNDKQTGALRWKHEIANIRERGASPAYIDGLLYLASGNAFFLIEPSTGHIILHKELPYSVNTNATPLVTKDLIVMGTQDYGIVALDRQTLEEQWHVMTHPALVYTSPYSRHPSATIDASPIQVDNTIYVGGSDGIIYGINAETGRITWKHKTGAPLFGTITHANGHLYVADYSGNVYSFSLPVGHE